MTTKEHWLVYSRQHNAWWRPKAAGYTYLIEEAGRYTFEDAVQHCQTRFAEDGSPEFMMLAPETAGELIEFYNETNQRPLANQS